MGSLEYDRETKEAVASEVLDGGRTVGEVARGRGIPYGTVYGWVEALERRREAEARADEERARRVRQTVTGRPGEVVLLDLETPRGRALVAVDRRRDGSPAGTVRRLAGATLGAGAVGGVVRRRWVVDVADLMRVAAAAAANDPGAPMTQAQAMRAMAGGAE